MAAFVFETITSAEASAYSAAADSLTFQTAGAHGALVTVRYLAPDQIGITLDPHTVTFGPGVLGETASFADGSVLFVGGPSDDVANGTDVGDGLYGGEGADALAGGAGDDLLQGNKGADTLNGGLGADVIYGGQGNDIVDVDLGSNFGQGNLGDDIVRAAAGSGPNTLLGGQGNDAVTGGDAADFLNGNLGDDTLNAGAGDDSLRGEGGVDVLTGGAGSDLFVFGAGSSNAAAGLTDRILDFTALDRIDVSGVGASLYHEISPSGGGYGYGYTPPQPFTYATALAQAGQTMEANPAIDIIAAQVGSDVVVFVDVDGDDTFVVQGDDTPDLAIVVVGASLDTLSAASFVGGQEAILGGIGGMGGGMGYGY